jgi:putative flippase GtrA
LAWQAVKYGLIGFVNTAVGVSLMLAGARLGLHYALYTAVAYLVALVVSFTLNLRITFRAEGHVWRRFRGFLAVCLACLGLAQAVQALLIEAFGCAEPFGVGAGMVSYTIAGFLLNRRFVFRPLDATPPR